MTPVILVIDIGSSSVRATTVGSDGSVGPPFALATPATRTSAGVVEYDGEHLVAAAIAVAERAIAVAPVPPVALAITNQRASTVLFDRVTGKPAGPIISWQDIRTTGQCLVARGSGLRLLPSQSATKLAWLLQRADPSGTPRWAFGTLETFLTFRLTHGAAHVTDASNAAVTGLVTADGGAWDPAVLDALGIPDSVLPSIVRSDSTVAPATALTGSPVISGLIGDQQASLIGQGRLTAGAAKITFGTGGMLDMTLGPLPNPPERAANGTFPIVAWRDGSGTVYGREGIALSAGSAVDWLVSGLGILRNAAESEIVASATRDSGGVSFVPALGGIGTPLWDLGARGALIGISGATTRHEVVRAVLEGVAHRGRDLLEAIESDSGVAIDELALDGGMSRNTLFVHLVANATGRTILRSAVTEATTVGAAALAGVATGVWASLDEATMVTPRPTRVEPDGTLDRERWLDARARALRTVPALSALTF